MTETVSKEAIEKALEVLGLVDQPDTDLNKGGDNADDNNNTPTPEELAKAKEVEEITAKAKELGFNLVKADGGTSAAPATASPDLGSEANGGTVTPQPTPQVGRKEVEALGVLLKAQQQENSDLRKAVDSIAEFNGRLAERLNMIEKQPLDRKSITTAKYIDKDFSKGGEGSSENKDGVVLSLSNPVHRNTLTDAMFTVAVKEGKIKDEEFAKAIEYVEMTKSLGGDARFAKRISDRLKNELKINLVR